MSSRHGELQKLGFVGPPYRTLWGTLTLNGFFDYLTNIYRDYKHHKVFATYSLRDPTLMVADLDIIRDILGKNFNQFPSRSVQPKYGTPLLDSTMLTVNGEPWKKLRKAFSSFFSTAQTRDMSEVISEKSSRWLETVKERQESGEPVELRDICSSLAMEVVVRVAFGEDIDSIKDPENAFIKNGQSLINSFMNGFSVNSLFPFHKKLPDLIRPRLVKKSVHEFFEEFMDKALETRFSSEDSALTSKVKGKDVIQMMVDAQKGDGLQDERIVGAKKLNMTHDQMLGFGSIFLLAGFETVSTALSFTVFQLAMFPEHLQKCQDEIDSVLGGDVPDYNNVQELTYLDMCINESLRLYSPGSVIERRSVEEGKKNGT